HSIPDRGSWLKYKECHLRNVFSYEETKGEAENVNILPEFKKIRITKGKLEVNARPHASKQGKGILESFGWNALFHSMLSPDAPPTDNVFRHRAAFLESCSVSKKISKICLMKELFYDNSISCLKEFTSPLIDRRMLQLPMENILNKSFFHFDNKCRFFAEKRSD
ncbi:hypothetical protein AVEN_135567-1, partial [Araneus ventricosus]